MTAKYRPDELRAQINKMWLRQYPAGPTDENWILNVGIGAGMLSVAADSIAELETAKDGAYAERNQCVALIARMVIEMGGMAARCPTAIDGWSPDWNGCVYIDLPTGQVSWHYHDSHAWMFADLPEITIEWDGHDTPEKYRRVNAWLSSASDADHLHWCACRIGKACNCRSQSDAVAVTAPGTSP